MAALNRPKIASYEVHESVCVDTQDNEDHTFCGIMFPVKAKTILPIERIIIHSIAVRGQLGELSVWVSNDNITTTDNNNNNNQRNGNTYNFRLTPKYWTKIYTKFHKPSRRQYDCLNLTESQPIIIKPGQVRMIYIHSTLRGDEAIVYDNTDPSLPLNRPYPPRYEDNCISIHTGKAHLSETPFGRLPIWGWGDAYRDRREFVGQLGYGVVYALWNPELHYQFGPKFHKITEILLMMQRRLHDNSSNNNNINQCCPSLPDECIYYILNMCRWDWLGDDNRTMNRWHSVRKRKERQIRQQQQQQDADAARAAAAAAAANRMTDNSSNNNNDDDDDDVIPGRMEVESASNNWAVQFVQEQLRQQQNDSSDSDDDDEDSEDASAWERANGYRADNTAFSFHDISSVDSSSSDSDDDLDNDDNNSNQMAGDGAHQGVGWFIRRQFDRIHVLRELNRNNDNNNNHNYNDDNNDDDDDDSDDDDVYLDDDESQMDEDSD